MKGYKTSKDFTHLRDLLDKGIRVVCFVTYNFNKFHPDEEPIITTDICFGKVFNEGSPEYRHYSFGARGIEYCDYWPSMDREKKTFEETCEEYNIEYIEPTEE